MIQLELFEESIEQKVERKIKYIEDKFEKVRRSLYARNSELIKLCDQQKNDIEILKSALCRCGLEIQISQNDFSFYKVTQVHDENRR